MLSDRARLVLRTTALMSIVPLVLVNFLLPTIAPPVDLPDDPYIELGKRRSEVTWVEWGGRDDHYFYRSWNWWFLEYYYQTSIEIVDVFSAGETLLWEDIEIGIDSKERGILIEALHVLPVTVPVDFNMSIEDNGIQARYENAVIKHGHVYTGDTLSLMNVPEELHGAKVTITLGGEDLASYRLKLVTHIQIYM